MPAVIAAEQDNGPRACFPVQTGSGCSAQIMPLLKEWPDPVRAVREGNTERILFRTVPADAAACIQTETRFCFPEQMREGCKLSRVNAPQFNGGSLLASAERTDHIPADQHCGAVIAALSAGGHDGALSAAGTDFFAVQV